MHRGPRGSGSVETGGSGIASRTKTDGSRGPGGASTSIKNSLTVPAQRVAATEGGHEMATALGNSRSERVVAGRRASKQGDGNVRFAFPYSLGLDGAPMLPFFA